MDGGKGTGPFRLAQHRSRVTQLVDGGVGYSVSGGGCIVSVSMRSRSPLVYTALTSAIRTGLRSFVASCHAGGTGGSLRCCGGLDDSTGSGCRHVERRCNDCSSTGRSIMLRDCHLGTGSVRGRVRLLCGACADLRTRIRRTRTGLLVRAPTFAALRDTSIPLGPTKPGEVLFILKVAFVTFVIIAMCSVEGLVFER